MAVEHKDITHDQCHEPKHITNASTSDAGKVITPSSTTSGTSVLRNLTPAEVGALALIGGTLTGKLNIDHADGLEVQGDKVVGPQQSAIGDITIGTITNANNAGSADVTPTQDALDSLASKVNTILAALRAHGLIAT